MPTTTLTRLDLPDPPAYQRNVRHGTTRLSASAPTWRHGRHSCGPSAVSRKDTRADSGSASRDIAARHGHQGRERAGQEQETNDPHGQQTLRNAAEVPRDEFSRAHRP